MMRSLWLTSDAGTIHYSCGPPDAITALGERYRAAKIATPELGACCRNEAERGQLACAFDTMHNDLGEDTLLCYALAQAEGRNIDPPYRCAVHDCWTFGGCCAPNEGEE